MRAFLFPLALALPVACSSLPTIEYPVDGAPSDASPDGTFDGALADGGASDSTPPAPSDDGLRAGCSGAQIPPAIAVALTSTYVYWVGTSCQSNERMFHRVRRGEVKTKGDVCEAPSRTSISIILNGTVVALVPFRGTTAAGAIAILSDGRVVFWGDGDPTTSEYSVHAGAPVGTVMAAVKTAAVRGTDTSTAEVAWIDNNESASVSGKSPSVLNVSGAQAIAFDDVPDSAPFVVARSATLNEPTLVKRGTKTYATLQPLDAPSDLLVVDDGFLVRDGKRVFGGSNETTAEIAGVAARALFPVGSDSGHALILEDNAVDLATAIARPKSLGAIAAGTTSAAAYGRVPEAMIDVATIGTCSASSSFLNIESFSTK